MLGIFVVNDTYIVWFNLNELIKIQLSETLFCYYNIFVIIMTIKDNLIQTID